jgi:hypothetical protein
MLCLVMRCVKLHEASTQLGDAGLLRPLGVAWDVSGIEGAGEKPVWRAGLPVKMSPHLSPDCSATVDRFATLPSPAVGAPGGRRLLALRLDNESLLS